MFLICKELGKYETAVQHATKQLNCIKEVFGSGGCATVLLATKERQLGLYLQDLATSSANSGKDVRSLIEKSQQCFR